MARSFLVVLLVIVISAVPIETRALCPLPIIPEHGKIMYMDRYEGGIVSFGCDEGYWFNGTNPRNCMEDGKWSGTPGICEAPECKKLPPDPHGEMEYTQQGQTVIVTCDHGFVYSQPKHTVRDCQKGNIWSGEDGKCKAPECKKLPPDPHGEMEYTQQGQTVIVTCDHGFVYSQPKHTVRDCQKGNIWSGEDGKCKEITCPSPNTPEHIQIHIPSLRVNSTATITCETGYQYEGNKSLTCQINGQWNGTIGTCQAVCPDIAQMEHGSVSVTGLKYNDSVTVTCHWDYALQGAGKITCQKDGQWSAPLGKCKYNKHFLWFLIILPAILLIIGFVTWKSRRKLQEYRRRWPRKDVTSSKPPEYLLTRQEDVNAAQHYRLTIQEEFEAGNSDPLSPEYMAFSSMIAKMIKFTLEEAFATTVEVVIICISQLKRMVVFDIRCEQGITIEQITDNLTSIKGDTLAMNVVSGSLHKMDYATSRFVNKIIKNKHVKDRRMDRTIDLESQYIRLKMFVSDNVGRPEELHRDTIELPDKYVVDLERHSVQYITDEEMIKEKEVQKFIVIRGRAGIGKTTLVQRLLWRWAHGEWATHLKAIFLLNLRILMAIDSKVSLLQIFSSFTTYGYTGVKLESKWITENEKYLGIIIDGIDELHNFKDRWDCSKEMTDLEEEVEPVVWGISLMRQTCLPKATIITTSRPFPALNLLMKNSTMLIELMGLTQDRVMDFVNKNVSQERRKMVKQTLQRSPILMSVCSITFYCATLCRVLEEDIGVTDKLTTYTHITAYITEMFIKRSMNKSGSSEISEEVSTTLRSLCQLAYSGLITRTRRGVAQLVFGEDDLKQHGIEPDDVKIEETGLFLRTEVEDPSSRHVLGEFAHLSIQEFMAMIGLLSYSSDDLKKTLRSFAMSGQFNMSLLFLYGLTFDVKSKQIRRLCRYLGLQYDVNEDVRNILIQNVLEVIDNLQALQIIHESQSQELAHRVGKKMFPKGVEFCSTKLTVVDVLALAFLLKHHSTATSIHLEYVGLDLVCLTALAQLLRSNNSVKNVRLCDGGVNDDGVEQLAQAIQENRSLRYLTLVSDSLTDKGIAHLATLMRNNENLQSLRLDSDSITDQGVEALTVSLRGNRTLQTLGLTSRGITDKGVGHLAQWITDDRTLELQGFEVKDKGAEALLAALKEHKAAEIMIERLQCSADLKKQLNDKAGVTYTM